MDNFNNIVVPNGVLRMAPGIRFMPTDEVLITQYLRRKVQGLPLSPSEYAQIPEANVFTTDPWHLEGDPQHARYFFSTRDDNRITTTGGVWRDSGENEQISNSQNQQVIGSKKTYGFFINNAETNWKLHEYTVDNSIQGWDNWVLCRLFAEAPSSSGSSVVTDDDGEISD